MNAAHKDGGPAFPVDNIVERDTEGRLHGKDISSAGLSKRAYFAGRAMEGLLANPGGPIQANGRTGWSLTNCREQDVASIAVSMADALIAELAKEQPHDR